MAKRYGMGRAVSGIGVFIGGSPAGENVDKLLQPHSGDEEHEKACGGIWIIARSMDTAPIVALAWVERFIWFCDWLANIATCFFPQNTTKCRI
jgi:hypothetical protein